MEVPAISGCVLGYDGRPIPGATVEITNKPDRPGSAYRKTIETDSAGAFRYAGKSRFFLYIIPAGMYPLTAQVQAKYGYATSITSSVEYRADIRPFGIGKPPVHDVGELRVPASATWP